MSCESPRPGDSSLSEVARVLASEEPRRVREASSLVTNDSSSSSKGTTAPTAVTDSERHTPASTVSFFATVCALLFFVLLAAYLTNARRFRASDQVIACRTTPCKLASGYLSTLVDRNVEPCDDFYQHVCGKWTKDRDGLSFLGDTFQRYLAELRRRLAAAQLSSVSPKLRFVLGVGKRFVQECFRYMEEPELEVKQEVGSLLEVLDVMAILNSESSFDALLQALTLSFTTGLSSVVSIRRRQTEGRVYLHIFNSRPFREELMSEATDRAIETYLEKVIRVVSGDKVRGEAVVSSLLLLDNAVAQRTHASWSDVDVWMHVADLIGDPAFPVGLWDVAFGSFKANEPVQGHDNAVLFTGLNATRLVTRKLEDSPVNVTSWYLVAVILSQALRFDFVKRFGENYPYRSEHLCLDATIRALEPDWPMVLLQLAFNGVDFAGAEALFDSVRRAAMVTPEWLDNATAKMTRERLRQATLTSFATSFDNATATEVSFAYASGAATLNRSFLASYVVLHQLGQEASIRNPPDGFKGALSSVELRGRVLYKDLYNTVFLPLVYLRHPIFYNSSVASYYNYGTLGAILSKELVEAVSPFSPRGDSEDSGEDSGRPSWWSEAARREFSYRISCYRAFDDHFHKGRLQDVDRMSVAFQRNLFAWLRAAKVSYEAMKADFGANLAVRDRPALWKSAQKVFFRRFCLVACGLDRTEPLSAKERCLWPLLNMAEFVESFGCPNNSFMASRQNCHFF
ncbi:hypothetical protein V5799_012535 [Amblyomma americanum]|uniref:M13 family peptidase n=1 Tax=Amblyomma americanum TaxID=6943 RepID=A0AAQ4EEG0_AMBAM